tara:strand:+ start:815 stop:1549 length:735 start_codon:yes stop_codon:yes gene_type:complete
MPETSIIITNYNGERCVQDAIRSVCDLKKEDYKDFDLTIVDDGSSDNSLNVIERSISEFSKDVDIETKIITKENGGTASARNAGLKGTSSKFVGFLDCDDQYLSGKISKSIEYLSMGDHIGIVYSDYISKDDAGRTQYVSRPTYSYDRLFEDCIVSTNCFVNRKAVESVGLFDESIKIIEDYDLWLRICSNGYIGMHIPFPGFLYYDLSSNKTNVEMKNGGMLFGKETTFIKKRITEGKIVLSS